MSFCTAEVRGSNPLGSTLKIRSFAAGERKVDEEEERAGYYVRELRHGSFRHSMLLPEGIEEEKIRARYQDGILEVTLEGAAAAR